MAVSALTTTALQSSQICRLARRPVIVQTPAVTELPEWIALRTRWAPFQFQLRLVLLKAVGADRLLLSKRQHRQQRRQQSADRSQQPAAHRWLACRYVWVEHVMRWL